MPELSRRGFLGAATAITGAAAIGVAAPAAEAESAPKPKLHGDIRDIKRVVILMQENRSFDHYYGSLRGVRGFADRSSRPTLPGTSRPARRSGRRTTAGPTTVGRPSTRPGTAV